MHKIFGGNLFRQGVLLESNLTVIISDLLAVDREKFFQRRTRIDVEIKVRAIVADHRHVQFDPRRLPERQTRVRKSLRSIVAPDDQHIQRARLVLSPTIERRLVKMILQTRAEIFSPMCLEEAADVRPHQLLAGIHSRLQFGGHGIIERRIDIDQKFFATLIAPLPIVEATAQDFDDERPQSDVQTDHVTHYRAIVDEIFYVVKVAIVIRFADHRLTSLKPGVKTRMCGSAKTLQIESTSKSETVCVKISSPRRTNPKFDGLMSR